MKSCHQIQIRLQRQLRPTELVTQQQRGKKDGMRRKADLVILQWMETENRSRNHLKNNDNQRRNDTLITTHTRTTTHTIICTHIPIHITTSIGQQRTHLHNNNHLQIRPINPCLFHQFPIIRQTVVSTRILEQPY